MCKRALVKKAMVKDKINDDSVRESAYPTMFHLFKIKKLFKLWMERGEYLEICRVFVKGYSRRVFAHLMLIIVRLANTLKRKIANQLLCDEDATVPSDCDDEVCTAIWCTCVSVSDYCLRIVCSVGS